jgi:hypothetical protein
MNEQVSFRAYLWAVIKGDAATAARLSKHFPRRGAVLLCITFTLLIVAPFSLIYHGADWPRSLILILGLSIPLWVLAVLAVRWNGSPSDDGDEDGCVSS